MPDRPIEFNTIDPDWEPTVIQEAWNALRVECFMRGWIELDVEVPFIGRRDLAKAYAESRPLWFFLPSVLRRMVISRCARRRLRKAQKEKP